MGKRLHRLQGQTIVMQSGLNGFVSWFLPTRSRSVAIHESHDFVHRALLVEFGFALGAFKDPSAGLSRAQPRVASS
jgi:hypothetical protein